MYLHPHVVHVFHFHEFYNQSSLCVCIVYAFHVIIIPEICMYLDKICITTLCITEFQPNDL